MKDPKQHRLWRSLKLVLYWLENFLRLLFIKPELRRQVAPGRYEQIGAPGALI